MKSITKILLVVTLLAAIPQAWGANDNSNKKERNFIRQGNELYRQNDYAGAEVQYRKALNANPNSETAQFNLASALLMQANQAAAMRNNKQGNTNDEERIKALLDTATTTLNNIAQYSTNKELSSKAYYDLGNIAYQSENYQGAIDAYKNALRRNPDYNEARHNLRLAQLKMQQKQNNKDQNKNDQNKDNKDKQDKQDKQDQNKDKQDKDKQNQDKQQQNQEKQQQQPQQQQGMSRQNMDQVLKANQDQERATREKMNAIKARSQQEERARTNKRW